MRLNHGAAKGGCLPWGATTCAGARRHYFICVDARDTRALQLAQPRTALPPDRATRAARRKLSISRAGGGVYERPVRAGSCRVAPAISVPFAVLLHAGQRFRDLLRRRQLGRRRQHRMELDGGHHAPGARRELCGARGRSRGQPAKMVKQTGAAEPCWFAVGMRKQQLPVRRMCGWLLCGNNHSDRMRAGGNWLLFTWRFGSGHESDMLSYWRCAAVSLRTCRLPGARAEQVYVKRCIAGSATAGERVCTSAALPYERANFCIIFNK